VLGARVRPVPLSCPNFGELILANPNLRERPY
jgi:hypothetical protein